MKKIFIILLLTISFLNAANLLTYNIYERSDRVDVMLSFDSPYEGSISKKRGENITVLTLTDLTYDKLVEKNINSTILQAVAIEPKNDTINIILKSDANIGVIASKTIDGFGLRIRNKPIASPSKDTTTLNGQTNNQSSTIQTKPSENLVDSRYISVIVLLTIMILFMLWIKKRVSNTQNTKKEKSTWLFNNTEKNLQSKEVNILHKKQIDNANSVVLLEFENSKYLVMTGSSNLLLERFSNGEVQNSSDFEKAFEDNRKKLDDYLKIQQDSPKEDYRSKLERY